MIIAVGGEVFSAYGSLPKVAKTIDQYMVKYGTGVAVVGLEVPHAHIHLVPIKNITDIDFTRPKLKFSSEELQNIAEGIKKFVVL